MADLVSIELFWRAANYLTVGMLYLKENPLLKSELAQHHFKDTILGHWGACPSINAIYAHVSDWVRRNNQTVSLIVGTGHAGTALLPCMFLDGSLVEYYPEFSMDEQGICSLFNAYSKREEFPSEISMSYPGTIYVGGELGSALAFSQGFVMRNPNKITVCVIGDGELETSITQASWQGFTFLSNETDGKVLPVINANGYKMGSPSLLSLRTRTNIIQYFKSFGLDAIFVGNDHSEIAKAFDKAFSLLLCPYGDYRPVVVLDTPKGWTAPINFGNRSFEGHFNSHKPILRNPRKNNSELQMIANWLSSYRPAELFNQNGTPLDEVTRCLPPKTMRLGHSHVNNITKYCVDNDMSYSNNVGKAEAVAAYLSHAIDSENVLVFSPDELASNRMQILLNKYKLKVGKLSNEFFNKHSQVYEILNEHLCFAWACGCSASGHYPVIISYEAFAPAFSSMAEQFVKSLIIAKKNDWQPDRPSLNILLTSIGWYNTPTHHNPCFIDGLIGRGIEQIRIYMPVFIDSAVRFLHEMLGSCNRMNVMVFDKHSHGLDGYKDQFFCHQSWLETKEFGSNIDVAIIAIGDCMLEQVLGAHKVLKNECSGYKIKVIAVEDMSLLEDANHPDRHYFNQVIENIPTVWVYNGFTKAIKGLIWGFRNSNLTTVLGYNGYDQTPSGEKRFNLNGVGISDIVAAVKEFVEEGY